MPDLIVLNPRVVQKKYAAKGLFEDLYPYLDKDASLGGREAILPDILRISATRTASCTSCRPASGFTLPQA
jgi:hypothetical protein